MRTAASSRRATEEERIIVWHVREEEPDIRDRVAGLFRQTYRNCFVFGDAVAWLVDRGICPHESAAVRFSLVFVGRIQNPQRRSASD